MKEKNNWWSERGVSKEEKRKQILIKIDNLTQFKDVFSQEYIKAKHQLRTEEYQDKKELLKEIENIKNIYFAIVKHKDELLVLLSKEDKFYN